jgi:hypothetical protein
MIKTLHKLAFVLSQKRHFSATFLQKYLNNHHTGPKNTTQKEPGINLMHSRIRIRTLLNENNTVIESIFNIGASFYTA